MIISTPLEIVKKKQDVVSVVQSSKNLIVDHVRLVTLVIPIAELANVI